MKPSKPAKEPRAPKPEKAISLGSAQKVKIEKPKKVKEPKVRAPKPEKPIELAIGKAEKVTAPDGVKLKKTANLKIVAVALVAVAIVVMSVALSSALRDNETVIEPMSLSIESLPAKTTYYVGELAAFSGLKLKMTLTNGATVLIDGSECDITGFDSSQPVENQILTVNYKQLQATFSINVEELIVEIPTGNYCGLSFKTLPKTNYKVGEWIDESEGVLLVHYDDGSTREMPLDSEGVKRYGFTSDKPGTYTLTVKYVEGGRYGETSYTITVTE